MTSYHVSPSSQRILKRVGMLALHSLEVFCCVCIDIKAFLFYKAPSHECEKVLYKTFDRRKKMNPGERSLYDLIEKENIAHVSSCIESGADLTDVMKLLRVYIGNEAIINLIVEVNNARLTFDFICVSEWIDEYEMQRLISIIAQSKNLQIVISLTCISYRFSDLTLSRLIDVIVETDHAGDACTFACESYKYISLEQRDELMRVVARSRDPMLAAEFATSIREDLSGKRLDVKTCLALNELFLIVLQSQNSDAATMFVNEVRCASSFQKKALKKNIKRTYMVRESEDYASIEYCYA